MNPKKIAFRIIVLLICAVLSFGFILAVSAQSSTVVNAEASTTQPRVGSTLTVTLTISNVQNLGGIDATLTWNAAVLSLKSSSLNLGVDSHSNGVLHGKVNTDPNNLNPGDIYVQETKVSGSYQLIATEVGQTYSGFTGSGTIATLTFNVVGTGSAGLSLQSELADHPPAGQTANNIDHQDTASSVTAVAAGSSSTPSSSGTPGTSPTVPEFPSLAIITILIMIASATIALSTRMLRNKGRWGIKTAPLA